MVKTKKANEVLVIDGLKRLRTMELQVIVAMDSNRFMSLARDVLKIKVSREKMQNDFRELSKKYSNS